ncbi:hypothetical protein LAX5112_01122 [Roseibium alexandrii]|uniref:Uncharacterized protein n=1 Tax=Roseibium alexandrii TaxID=388408 RepID=A0A0M6ZXD7_9HYPH|nr:hypothetical protein LAX5112_01122 [Roseibium alexandrii]
MSRKSYNIITLIQDRSKQGAGLATVGQLSNICTSGLRVL